MKLLIILLVFFFSGLQQESVHDMNCEEKINLTIIDALGNPIPNATVSFQKCISSECNNAILTAYNTNSTGNTELFWSNNMCSVCKIYINGTEFTGLWEKNNSYTLTLN